MRVALDLLGGVAGVIHGNFLRQDGDIHGVLEGFDIKLIIFIAELHEVERRQVAGRIVQVHILGARIGGVDTRRVGRGVPLVDLGVELHARVAADPGGFGDHAQ